MTAKSKRLFVIAIIASLLGIATLLVLGALRDNIVFFYTPSEISQLERQSGRRICLESSEMDSRMESVNGKHSQESFYVVHWGQGEWNNSAGSGGKFQ